MPKAASVGGVVDLDYTGGRGRHTDAGTVREDAAGNILRDLRLAFRLLLKSPAFTSITLLALALGIAANTVIFSAFDAVLLRPLPYPNPDAVVTVWDSFPRQGVKKIGVTYANFADLKARSRVFDPLALYV